MFLSSLVIKGRVSNSVYLQFIVIFVRAVYWQESGDTIHITRQGLQSSILEYIAIL